MVSNIVHKIISIIFLSCFLVSSVFSADVYLNLTQKSGRRIFVLIKDFKPNGKSSDNNEYDKIFKKIINDDLSLSKIFKIEDLDIDTKSPKNDGSYEAWLIRNLDYIISGSLNYKKDKKISVKLVDVANKEELMDKDFEFSDDNVRDVGHNISDEIFLLITGHKGLYSTKIAFSSDITGYKEIYTVGYDGNNLKQITFNKSISILPRWKPGTDDIIYTSYLAGNPDLFFYDSKRKKSFVFSKQQGLNSAAEYSPDGSQIAITMTLKGDPEICILDKKGKIVEQVTKDKGIDTSPTWAPNGGELAFISDRTGVPQIYIKNLKDSELLPITFDSRYKDSPAWSPRGNEMVFASLRDKKWDICIVNLMTKDITQLTKNSGNNENPSWSPDGQKICFTSTRDKKRELYIMDRDGNNQKKVLSVKGRIFTPKWDR